MTTEQPKDWENHRVVGRNKQPAHATLLPYADLSTALAGNREKSPYEVQYFNGGGIGIALDTMIGPIRATGGWGEGGRFRFYFTAGPQF